MFCTLLLRLFLSLHVLVGILGHGRLWEPPSRSSMWRLGYNTTINTDDNELSCGGFTNQWVHFGGKCGICGDPFQQRPRDNEYGGKYASGWITRTYPVGGIIDVIVDLTANHEGFFEFRLCPTDTVTGADPAVCSDSNRLGIVNGEAGGYRYYIRDPTLNGHIRLQVALPKHIMCKHCLFQWKYITATRWGCDSQLRCEKGIGPQEQFYGCSDISIENVPSTVFRDPVYYINHKKMDTLKPKDIASLQTTTGYRDHVGIDTRKNFHPSYSKIKDFKFGNSDDSFTKYLHQIIMDAIMKHHGSGAQIRQPALADCKAATAFAKNPIVNEWCHRTCPQNRDMCQSHMCVCKTFMKATPKWKSDKLSYTIIKGGDETRVFNTLGMSKAEFTSFVRRVLKTYRSARTQRVPHPMTQASGRVPSFVTNTKPVVVRTGMPEIPKRTKIFFIDFPDKKPILRPPTQSFKKPSHRKTGHTIKRTLPTKSDLDLKVEDDRNLSNNNFGSRTKKTLTCVASKEFAHNKYMNRWCMRNCSFGFCPSSVCTCL